MFEIIMNIFIYQMIFEISTESSFSANITAGDNGFSVGILVNESPLSSLFIINF